MQVKNLGEVGRRGETGVIERESGKKSRVVGREGETGGSQDVRRPNPTNKEPDPSLTMDRVRGIQREGRG